MKTKTLFFMLIFVFSLTMYSQLIAQSFDFNDGTTQGWTLDQMYVTSSQTKFTPVMGYTLMNSNNELSAYASALLIGNTEQNDIYLESPDLLSNSDWQNISGYSIDVKRLLYSPCWGDIPNQFYVQLQIKVIDTADGNKEKLFAEHDGTDFVFHEIQIYSQLYQFTWKPSWLTDPKYKVKKVRIRITEPGDVTSECWYRGSWNIDNVTAVGGSGPTESITITNPNGGEKWEAGMQHNITWTGQGIDNYDVKIEYSTNNGATYTFVDYETNHGTSGSYAWTVPNTPSTQCLIRLSVLLPPEISDVSDAVFEITQPSQPFIFTGQVYQGNPPDISTPVGSITVKLYGDDDEWPESGPKTELASTTTNSSGGFNLNSGSGNSNYNYYHVIETDPAGAISVGAQAGHPGYVKNFNCISYENATLMPGNTYSGSAFWDIQSSSGNTQPGADVLVTLSDDVSITFDEVTTAGNTTLETSHTGPEPPNNFVVHPPSAPMYYDINTIASYSGLIHLKINYDDTEIDTEMEDDLRIFKYIESNSEWLGVTTSVDIDNNFIYGNTDHLSIYAIMFQTGGAGESGLIVTNCDDSGTGSLRDAILYANNNPGPDTIRFQIPKNIPGHDSDIGVWIIAPQSELPTVTDFGLIIDGFSQREFIGEDCNPQGPEIWLNGELAGQYSFGLRSTAAGTDIVGLTISNFQNAGITMDGVDGGRISGCYVGVDFGGNAPAANGYGIWVGNNSRNVGITPIDTFKNVISGNTDGGVIVADTSSHVFIQGNIIGLNRTGMYAIGNGNYGGIRIDYQCDSVEVFDNWIGGNKFGIYVLSSHNITIGNNFIGSNRINDEIIELGNEADGIYLAEGARDNVIIENFIRFNGANGVYITGTNTIRNRVSHNHISGNGWSGIFNESGGNLELAPPVISSVSTASVTGTAIPNATVEIYTDPEYQGLIFQGETNSDASGNFTWNGEITGQFTNVTAIAIDEYGNTSIFSEVTVITSVEQLEQNNIPETFSLFQNYPNPFNPRTTIQFEIPYTEKSTVMVAIQIYNLQGELIRTLMNEDKSSGAYKVLWDGLDEGGNTVATGIYLYRIRAGEFAAMKKMILIN